MMKADTFAYFGSHPEELDGGRPLGHGDSIQLTADQQNTPNNKRLIEEGKLVSQTRTRAPKSEQTKGEDES